MNLRLEGQQEIARFLQRLADAPKKHSAAMRDAMNTIGEALLEKTAERFATETDPYATPWRPLAPTTRRTGQVLSLTGRLRRSFNRQITENSVEVGTNVYYAKFHQGDPLHPNFPGKRVPRRPFFPWRGEPNNIQLPDDYMAEVRETLDALFEVRA